MGNNSHRKVVGKLKEGGGHGGNYTLRTLKKHGLDRASESYIDAIYYHEMFHFNACWKTSSMVDRELKKIRSKSAKLNALKENIRIRVLGLGWKDLATPWSRDSRELTPDKLIDHLKNIISYQRTRGMPKDPPVDFPKRKMLPTLGSKTSTLSEKKI